MMSNQSKALDFTYMDIAKSKMKSLNKQHRKSLSEVQREAVKKAVKYLSERYENSGCLYIKKDIAVNIILDQLSSREVES